MAADKTSPACYEKNHVAPFPFPTRLYPRGRLTVSHRESNRRLRPVTAVLFRIWPAGLLRGIRRFFESDPWENWHECYGAAEDWEPPIKAFLQSLPGAESPGQTNF